MSTLPPDVVKTIGSLLEAARQAECRCWWDAMEERVFICSVCRSVNAGDYLLLQYGYAENGPQPDGPPLLSDDLPTADDVRGILGS